jgi:hypothetical protein
MAPPDQHERPAQNGTDRLLRVLLRHSGSARDTELANELLAHLRPLERFGVDVWTEDRIRAGDQTRNEIDVAISEADVALLLLSADFLGSDILQDVEVPKLLERHRVGALRVIPVVLRFCIWDAHPWLSELRPLPKSGEAIASFDGDRRDRVLTELARDIVGLSRTPTTVHAKSAPSTADNSGADRQFASMTSSGAATYNSHIHGSTIGAIGGGDGALVAGVVGTAPRDAQPAEVNREIREPLKLVAIGPHIIARGELLGADGSLWSVWLEQPFVRGDTAILASFGDTFESLPKKERYVALEAEGHGRILARPPRWRKKTDGVSVDLSVEPPLDRFSATTLGPESPMDLAKVPMDITSITEVVHGVEVVPQLITRVLSICKDGWGAGAEIGSRVAELCKSLDASLLENLIAIEIERLATVPFWNSLDACDTVVFGFVSRVRSVRLLPAPADSWVRVELVLDLHGVPRAWSGFVNVCLSTTHLGPQPPAPLRGFVPGYASSILATRDPLSDDVARMRQHTAENAVGRWLTQASYQVKKIKHCPGRFGRMEASKVGSTTIVEPRFVKYYGDFSSFLELAVHSAKQAIERAAGSTALLAVVSDDAKAAARCGSEIAEAMRSSHPRKLSFVVGYLSAEWEFVNVWEG